jgi:uncharacterized protein YdiU (UPF0061 family)
LATRKATMSLPTQLRIRTSSLRDLPASAFARAASKPLRDPRVVAVSPEAAALVGLRAEDVLSQEFIELVNGEAFVPGGEPIALAYGGHSFGFYHPSLGDGRNLLLADVATTDGAWWDLAVKGGGPTVFSRRCNGRLSLESALKELLMSEHMAAIGVPTTRTLCVIASSESALTYHRLKELPAALLVRLAPTHLRFGSLEYLFHRHDEAALFATIEHVVRRNYPKLVDRSGRPDPSALLAALVHGSAALAATWQAAGFVHGVHDTHNASLACVTLDYGPCGFLDDHDPNYVPAKGDQRGRYRYGGQAEISEWNLACVAQTFIPFIGIDVVREICETYRSHFDRALTDAFAAKLGFLDAADERVALLVQRLPSVLEASRADHPRFFSDVIEAEAGPSTFDASDDAPVREWLADYRALTRLSGDPGLAARRRAKNPRVVPRGHVVKDALEAANLGDLTPFQRLWDAVRRPFAASDDDPLRSRPPEAARNLRWLE